MKNPGSLQTITKYYSAGGQTVAVRTYTIPENQTSTYLLGDHLGSTSLAVDASTGAVTETRYKPFGEVRYTTPDKTLPTQYTYTGQYSYVANSATGLGSAGFGLMFYQAQFYDPGISQFTSPDTIVSKPATTHSTGTDIPTRTMIPVNRTDPTGHRNCQEDGYNCPGNPPLLRNLKETEAVAEPVTIHVSVNRHISQLSHVLQSSLNQQQ